MKYLHRYGIISKSCPHHLKECLHRWHSRHDVLNCIRHDNVFPSSNLINIFMHAHEVWTRISQETENTKVCLPCLSHLNERYTKEILSTCSTCNLFIFQFVCSKFEKEKWENFDVRWRWIWVTQIRAHRHVNKGVWRVLLHLSVCFVV